MHMPMLQFPITQRSFAFMGWRAVLSRRLETPVRRLFFLVSLIPTIGLIGCAVAAAYFYYQVHSDEFYVYSCHHQLASAEAGNPESSSEAGLAAIRSATARLRNRSTPEVAAIEDGTIFRGCLLRSYIGGDILNLEWISYEGKKFAGWALMLFLIWWSLPFFGSLVSWVRMK